MIFLTTQTTPDTFKTNLLQISTTFRHIWKTVKRNNQLCDVCPFAWNSALTEQIFIKFGVFQKSVKKIQVS
jgi:hypothetical protein